MKLSLSWQSGGWLLLGMFLGALGTHWLRPPPAPQLGLASAPAASASAVTKASPLAHPIPQSRERNALKPETPSEQPAVALEETLSIGDRLLRREKLRVLARELGATDLTTALQTGERIFDGDDRVAFMKSLFEFWGEQNPEAAADYAKNNLKLGAVRLESLSAALGAWGKLAPANAIKWLEKSGLEGPPRELATASVAKNWAEADPAAAGAWFVSSSSNSETVLGGVISSWVDLDPSGAASWAAALPDARLKNAAQILVTSHWARQSPELAAQYVQPLLASENGSVLAQAVVNAWGTQDPPAAAQWIRKLPPGEVQSEAAGTLASIWASSDVQAATQWASQIPDAETKTNVVGHLAGVWGTTDPQAALNWVNSLPVGALREEAQQGALDSWANTDPAEFERWMSTQAPPALRDRARETLSEVQVEKNAQAAFAVADKIADPSARREQLFKLYDYWFSKDQKSASKWLQSAPPEVKQTLQTQR